MKVRPAYWTMPITDAAMHGSTHLVARSMWIEHTHFSQTHWPCTAGGLGASSRYDPADADRFGSTPLEYRCLRCNEFYEAAEARKIVREIARLGD